MQGQWPGRRDMAFALLQVKRSLTFQASDRQAATAVFLLHRRTRGFFVNVSGVPGAGLEKNS